MLTGISQLGVRSPSCEVVLTDPSGEPASGDLVNVTHNVTDDEGSGHEEHYGGKRNTAVRGCPASSQKGRAVNMLNT